ncbi:hypothetical protein [Novosphingobium olei]|uniref:hypothetical protein n=1 Tax=Novosphingobium olei TaxID=2728851 RepID=UPI0030857656|nr:hypothetical protein NSDW_33130 [Novosphingobium olei]
MSSDVTVTQHHCNAAADLIEAYWPNDCGEHVGMRKLAQSYRAGHVQGVWAYAFARFEQEVLARHRAPDAEPVAGWIVANGAGDQWRTWDQVGPRWTKERDKATRYARREDAEAVHAEDEDAWLVQPYTHPAEPVAQAVEALRLIEHSIKQARIIGNDWRRELALIENTVSAALAAMGER